MKTYRPQDHRRRTLTENIGCYLSKPEAEALRSYVTAQRITISDYLRAVAIRPLMQAQAAEAEAQDTVD